MVTRRQLLKALGLFGPANAGHYVRSATLPVVVSAFGRTVGAAASIQFGYAAITWGNDYMKAIDEVAAAGFRGIQLRAGDGLLDRFGDTPAALRELLAGKHLAFPV